MDCRFGAFYSVQHKVIELVLEATLYYGVDTQRASLRTEAGARTGPCSISLAYQGRAEKDR